MYLPIIRSIDYFSARYATVLDPQYLALRCTIRIKKELSPWKSCSLKQKRFFIYARLYKAQVSPPVSAGTEVSIEEKSFELC